ncbi:MAG: protease SohB, partial [Halioglobus sp.]|nr:protease SohB [Halioglobus sp.]
PRRKGADTPGETRRKRLYVMDFDGDLRASATDSLREEISVVLSQAGEGDEVLLRVESPGGLVHGYGLAASQLRRIRDAGVPLTVAVDKVAASGGYMMACVGDRILAAPFAVLGSIGVLAQLPNFHRLLKKHEIDFELMTAGQYKRTLTVFGENTEEGRAKFLQELEETHDLFKAFVSENRPSLNIDKVATGEVWYGSQALAEGLIDEVKTSDALVQERLADWDVFAVKFVHKKNWQEKLGLAAEGTLTRLAMRLWQRDQGPHY